MSLARLMSATCGLQRRIPFAVPDQATWKDLSSVLSYWFQLKTGKALSFEHLQIMAAKLFGRCTSCIFLVLCIVVLKIICQRCVVTVWYLYSTTRSTRTMSTVSKTQHIFFNCRFNTQCEWLNFNESVPLARRQLHEIIIKNYPLNLSVIGWWIYGFYLRRRYSDTLRLLQLRAISDTRNSYVTVAFLNINIKHVTRNSVDCTVSVATSKLQQPKVATVGKVQLTKASLYTC